MPETVSDEDLYGHALMDWRRVRINRTVRVAIRHQWHLMYHPNYPIFNWIANSFSITAPMYDMGYFIMGWRLEATFTAKENPLKFITMASLLSELERVKKGIAVPLRHRYSYNIGEKVLSIGTYI